jgi:leucine dehydrogenase
MFEDLLRDWDGEEVAVRFDPETGTWMFVCVHDTTLGPAMGGTRMKVYGAPHEALADGLRLSAAMTAKQAAADLPYGGGKAVLAVPEVHPPGSVERNALLQRYARLVDSLHGTYVTAADMNTGQADMDVIGEVTHHVLGRSAERGGSGDPAVGTAIGVFHAIRATARKAFGTDDLAGRTVLIQGVGAVGSRLADHLHEAGASLIVADVAEDRARAVAERTGAAVIDDHEVIGVPCDVFSPCATGGVLGEHSIGRLACRAIAGAANNQLVSSGDDQRLAAAGILYAPDYVVNSGGVIWLTGFETLGWDEAAVRARLAGIETVLDDLFAAADRDGLTPAAAAARLARSRLDAGRA